MHTASYLNSGAYFTLMTFFNMCSSSRLELSKLWEDILEGNTSAGGGEGINGGNTRVPPTESAAGRGAWMLG